MFSDNFFLIKLLSLYGDGYLVNGDLTLSPNSQADAGLIDLALSSLKL